MLLSVKKWGNSQGIMIPKSILDLLSIKVNDELNVEIVDGSIKLKKINKNNDNFDDLILKDLIDEGYSGDELYNKFIEMRGRISKAKDNMIESMSKERTYTIDEVFNDWNKII